MQTVSIKVFQYAYTAPAAVNLNTIIKSTYRIVLFDPSSMFIEPYAQDGWIHDDILFTDFANFCQNRLPQGAHKD